MKFVEIIRTVAQENSIPLFPLYLPNEKETVQSEKFRGNVHATYARPSVTQSCNKGCMISKMEQKWMEIWYGPFIKGDARGKLL